MCDSGLVRLIYESNNCIISKMAASRYRKFLKLIEEWPVDPGKGRDLAMYIRERVAQGFQKGASSQIDERRCDEMYDALQKLNSDYYRNKYPRLCQTTATGSTLEQCKLVTAKDSMKDLGKSSWWKQVDSVKEKNS